VILNLDDVSTSQFTLTPALSLSTWRGRKKSLAPWPERISAREASSVVRIDTILPMSSNLLVPKDAPTSVTEVRTRITHHLARLVLAAFIFTFLISRILVIFIMARKLPPWLFFHAKGTHVHHLNYGISLLSIAGAYLIFARPMGRRLSAVAVVYGIGLGLTFDEFGMWLHLGGGYWQKASYDAIIIIASVLGLVAYGSTIRHWRPKHHITIFLLLVVLGVFAYVVKRFDAYANNDLAPIVDQLENRGPS
jgi:hypothetical protein